MSALAVLADCGLNPICHLVSAGGDAVGDVAGGAVEALAKAITDAVGDTIKTVATLWTKVGTPTIGTPAGGDAQPYAPGQTVGFLQGSLAPYLAVAAVVSVLIAGARMALEQNSRPGRELLKSLFTLVLVGGAGVTAVTLATQQADVFSDWIIARSTDDTDFGKNLSAMLLAGAAPGGAPAAILVILLGLLSIITCLLQVALMVMRGGMLVLLVGILPLTASFTNLEMGRVWFQKTIGWLTAFILNKPAAAIVYATAFNLTGSDVFSSGGLQSYITGLILMAMAILTLPALLKFCVPAVGALASGAGSTAGLAAGGLAIASTALSGGAAGVPTGAIAMTGATSAAGRGAGGSGPSGAGPASGSTGPGGGGSGSGGGGGGRGGGPDGGTDPDASTGPGGASEDPATSTAAAIGSAAGGSGARPALPTTTDPGPSSAAETRTSEGSSSSASAATAAAGPRSAASPSSGAAAPSGSPNTSSQGAADQTSGQSSSGPSASATGGRRSSWGQASQGRVAPSAPSGARRSSWGQRPSPVHSTLTAAAGSVADGPTGAADTHDSTSTSQEASDEQH